MIVSAGECCVLCAVLMAATYISVAEEEGAEPIELPTEEDGTGSHQQQQLGSDITPACCCRLCPAAAANVKIK